MRRVLRERAFGQVAVDRGMRVVRERRRAVRLLVSVQTPARLAAHSSVRRLRSQRQQQQRPELAGRVRYGHGRAIGMPSVVPVQARTGPTLHSRMPSLQRTITESPTSNIIQCLQYRVVSEKN